MTNNTHVTSNFFAQIGEAIGANVLERICETMQCNVGDVMDYVPETHRIQGDNDGDNLGGGQRTCQM